MTELQHGCGVFGIYGHPDAAELTRWGLHAVQHRGQESAGIVSAYASDAGRRQPNQKLGMGLAFQAIQEADLANLLGDYAVGHVRYSTDGGSCLANAQPILQHIRDGWAALCHNGTLYNAHLAKEQLPQAQFEYIGDSDSEVILHKISLSSQRSLEGRIRDGFAGLKGSASLAGMLDGKLWAFRDPSGNRPLVLGKFPDKGYPTVVASETVAFDIIQAEYSREVNPGELVVIDAEGVHSHQLFPPFAPFFPCIFELVYFSRPDSFVFLTSPTKYRNECGHILARKDPADADVVVSVPDSGTDGAIGYAEESGIPYERGIIRSHYVGRGFIEPSQCMREFAARLKYNPNPSIINNRRVIVVDDSLVRGTTIKKIASMLWRVGASEIHLRIASPVWIDSCTYGIDAPDPENLLGYKYRNLPYQEMKEKIAEHLKITSFACLEPLDLFLPESLPSHMRSNGDSLDTLCACTKCFTGYAAIHEAYDNQSILPIPQTL
ncbi:MAG TPA: amidophosphoribosyltransferase [Candidatus Nanoarchaeia archaeon]|nr:amidophosphoribosyltransferase [Candidatus Nanoarchaeia archaeon]